MVDCLPSPRFSILWWIDVFLGALNDGGASEELVVSVSSGGSMYFWGHGAGCDNHSLPQFQYPLVDRCIFGGTGDATHRIRRKRFQYPLVDRCIFGGPTPWTQ